jgi:hypothetical protein
MPLTTIRLGTEKTLTGVANKAFVIEGAGATARRRRAEQAILEANLALATRDGFRPGATVVVPHVPGLTLRDAPGRGGSGRTSNLSEVTRYAAGQVRAAQVLLERKRAEAEARAEEATERLKDDRVRKLVSEALPNRPELLDEAAAGIAKRRGIEAARADAFAEGMSKAADALDALAKRATAPKPP